VEEVQSLENKQKIQLKCKKLIPDDIVLLNFLCSEFEIEYFEMLDLSGNAIVDCMSIKRIADCIKDLKPVQNGFMLYRTA
jgi:hypothetical protein